MVSLDISGITYACDNDTLAARVGDAVYGPTLISSGTPIGDGGVYFVLGALHVVLSEQAVSILRGITPLPEPAFEEGQNEPSSSAPPAKRSRKR